MNIFTVFSAACMLLLRYFAKIVIWTVVIAVASIGIIFAIGLWISFFAANNETLLVVAIIVSLIAVSIKTVLVSQPLKL